MPRIPFDIGSDAADAEAGEGVYYDVEAKGLPPKGIYRCSMRRLRLKKNKNGDWMLNCVLEIAEPGSSKKEQYNGYGIWWNGNITKQGAGYINQFLDALTGGDAATRKAFWSAGPKVDDSRSQQPVVQAIGPKCKIDPDGMPIIVNAKKGKYQGEDKLEVLSFLTEHGSDDKVPDDDDDTEVDIDDDDTDVADDDDDDDEPPF